MAQRLPVVALCFGGLQPVCDSAQGGAGAARSEACAFSTHRIMRTQAHGRRASLTGGHEAPVVTHRACCRAWPSQAYPLSPPTPPPAKMCGCATLRCTADAHACRLYTAVYENRHPPALSPTRCTQAACVPTYLPAALGVLSEPVSPRECCALGMTLVCGRRRRHTYRRRAVRLVATVRLQTRSATTRTSQHS